MLDRKSARNELLNIHQQAITYGKLPSEILKSTTIDEFSFNSFVLREASKEAK